MAGVPASGTDVRAVARRLLVGVVAVALSHFLVGGCGDGDSSTVFLPGTPTISGVTAGDSQNTITWDAVSGATRYQLYWAKAPGVTIYSSQIGGVSSPYDHTGLTDGTTYYYCVRAENPAGASALSNEVSGTPAAASAPPAAPAISVTAGDRQNTITWAAVSGATGYNLYWAKAPLVTLFSHKLGSVSSPYDHTGLTDGTPYYYRATAVNAAGESALSNEVLAAPRAASSATPQASSALPAAPKLSSVLAGDGRNAITWDAVSGATSYTLYWNTVCEVSTASNQIVGVSSPYDHPGLNNGTTYHYRVTAVNAAGESALSNEISATPEAARAPPHQ